MSFDWGVMSNEGNIPPSAAVVDRWGDDILESLDEPASYHRAIAAVPDAIANVICVELLDWQVRNGGFHQYFYNSYGIMIHGAIQGFEAIGLLECATIARSARAQFGDHFPESREARIPVVGPIDDEKMSFDAADDAYYAIGMGEMHAVLDAYAEAAMKDMWQ